MNDTPQKYAEACHPNQWTVLGRKLRPFSVGHAILLDGQRSPYSANNDNATVKHEDLLVAVWTCARTYEQALTGSMSLRWKWWALRCKLRFVLDPSLFEDRAMMFANYIADHIGKTPRIWTVQNNSRPATAPTCLMLKATLMCEFGYTATEVLNMPFSQAVWEHLAVLDREGVAAFTTDLDEALMQAAKRIAEQEANAKRS